jgi:carbon-monoxide dehydrogenase small subunit
MTDTRSIRLTVNGREYTAQVEVRRHLADFLRHELGLYGTHIGCEQGACGACTVQYDGKAIKSCLMLAVQADGHHIRTVEGLAGRGELHPIQRAFHDEFGLQCGFCTPGFLMVAEALSRAGTKVEGETLRRELAGNICRCTGYVNIVAAVERFLQEHDDDRAGK